MFGSMLKGLAALVAVAGTAILGYWLMNLLRDADQAQVAAQASASARDEQSGAGSEEDRRPRRDPNNPYCWLSRYDSAACLAARIPTPPGYERVEVDPDGFTCWLRHLPVKPAGSPVKLYNGRLKGNQNAHCAVIDIDVGNKDLQQCADAVLRLRAEYLLASGRGGEIKFRTGTGFWLEWPRWEAGERPVLSGRGSWQPAGPKDSNYRNFRAYLDKVFTYVGTASLAPQLQRVPDVRQMQIGDVFIKPGTPGHAVIVVDLAECEGDKVFLLAQSYMPAQEVHILRNPDDPALSPWYELESEDELRTPEWTFPAGSLKRFAP